VNVHASSGREPRESVRVAISARIRRSDNTGGVSMRLVTIATLVATFALGGCASIVSGHNQSVSVISQSEGTDIAGARCSLSNDKGQWFATTPGSVTVRRSYAALAVDCKNDAAIGFRLISEVPCSPVAAIGAGIDDFIHKRQGPLRNFTAPLKGFQGDDPAAARAPWAAGKHAFCRAPDRAWQAGLSPRVFPATAREGRRIEEKPAGIAAGGAC